MSVELPRARRHPFAIVGVWLFELAAAYVIASPMHAWARSFWGAHPDGDAPIFRPGGLALIEWLNADGPALSIVVRTSALLFFVFGLGSQLVTGSLVAALVKPSRLVASLRVGLAAFFPLLAVGILFGLLEGMFIGFGYAASSHLDHSMQHAYGDERAFVARLVVLALFMIPVLVLGVVGDLARVAVARDVAEGRPGKVLKNGLGTALRTARAHLGRACLGWTWRAVISCALIVVGSLAGDRTGAKAGGALWVLFALHQLLILGRAALRTSWLAHALRLLAPEEEDEEEPASKAAPLPDVPPALEATSDP